MCRFTEEQVEQIDKNKQWSRTLDGSDYLPGMVLILVLAQNSTYVSISAVVNSDAWCYVSTS